MQTQKVIHIADVFDWDMRVTKELRDCEQVNATVVLDLGVLEPEEVKDAIEWLERLRWPKAVTKLCVESVYHYTDRSDKLRDALIDAIVRGPSDLQLVGWPDSCGEEFFRALAMKGRGRGRGPPLISLEMRVAFPWAAGGLEALLRDGKEGAGRCSIKRLHLTFIHSRLDTDVWKGVARAIENSTTLTELKLCDGMPLDVIPTCLPISLERFHLQQFYQYETAPFTWLTHERWPLRMHGVSLVTGMTPTTEQTQEDMERKLIRDRLSRLEGLTWRFHERQPREDQRVLEILSKPNNIRYLELSPSTPGDMVKEMILSPHALMDTLIRYTPDRLLRWTIVGKTRIRSGRSEPTPQPQTPFERALESKWFQVMQVLLSIRTIPRLTLWGKATPSLTVVPWPDFLHRIAEILGWSIPDLFL